MTCGGSMMRASHKPLAGLIDAAAVNWLAAEKQSPQSREDLHREITSRFDIGNRPEITFHGLEYQLTIERNDNWGISTQSNLIITAHRISRNN
jgi:hypothetical protein